MSSLRDAKQAHAHLTGYSSSFSVAPGEEIGFMVSCTTDDYEVDFVKVSQTEEGLREWETGSDGFHRRVQKGRRQESDHGSYIELERIGEHLRDVDGWSVSLWFLPTRLDQRDRVLVSARENDVADGWELTLGGDSHLTYTVHLAGTSRTVSSRLRLRERQWHQVGLSHSRSSATLRVRSLGKTSWDQAQLQPAQPTAVPSSFLIGRRRSPTENTSGQFDGRVEDIVFRTSRSDEVIARWDFSSAMESVSVPDRGPLALRAALHNMPTRAVTGHRWTGEFLDFRLRPDHYGRSSPAQRRHRKRPVARRPPDHHPG